MFFTAECRVNLSTHFGGLPPVEGDASEEHHQPASQRRHDEAASLFMWPSQRYGNVGRVAVAMAECQIPVSRFTHSAAAEAPFCQEKQLWLLVTERRRPAREWPPTFPLHTSVSKKEKGNIRGCLINSWNPENIVSFLLCNSSARMSLRFFPCALFVPRFGNFINKYSLGHNNKTTQGRAGIHVRCWCFKQEAFFFFTLTYNLYIYLDVFVGLLYDVCAVPLLPHCPDAGLTHQATATILNSNCNNPVWQLKQEGDDCVLFAVY